MLGWVTCRSTAPTQARRASCCAIKDPGRRAGMIRSNVRDAVVAIWRQADGAGLTGDGRRETRADGRRQTASEGGNGAGNGNRGQRLSIGILRILCFAQDDT